ncbi:hypothetical protein HME9302_01902 [Alteripontixanthobacter maritimus]|uniref:DUF3429 domain-containing protein n=1 Tax=Alteripontixanthobacter maritimus TaxID=2161824 RepID=A0A369QBS3_9SPHN|nr:DUF3429 domain-containing protein [Alteripontixanthobacter maritimus]RDC60687.1 hypothetical protein HME9302_01902 [Alteripontixanthobacter maritimus]
MTPNQGGTRAVGIADIPMVPRMLGFAGLLPQLACVVAVWLGPEEWLWTAKAIGFGYAAIIFSFLGGMWWGLAAATSLHTPGSQSKFERGQTRTLSVPSWIWFAAIAPSLIALAAYLPWIFGGPWPGPSMIVLGGAIAGSLWVDRALGKYTPDWWMALRIPLSLTLGAATVLLA